MNKIQIFFGCISLFWIAFRLMPMCCIHINNFCSTKSYNI